MLFAACLRADGEFAKPALLDYAEHAGGLYTIGLPRNSRLEGRAARLRRRAARHWRQSGQTARLYSDFLYKAKRWSRPRRVAAKCEYGAPGANLRACACSSLARECAARSVACGSIWPAAGRGSRCLAKCSSAWRRSAPPESQPRAPL